MKLWRLAAGAALVASIPALSVGCEPAPLGELILVITSDMAPPKDFNKIRIQAFNEGVPKFDVEGELPGDPADQLRIVLPSTLGLVAPENKANAIKIVVGVRSGGPGPCITDADLSTCGPVRVVRTIVTTIPADRVAMLPVPIQFLCKQNNIFQDNNGDLADGCGDGETCIAGRCETNKVDSSTLPDYDPEQVFGGGNDAASGKCFDVATCLETAELVDEATIDLQTCSFPVPNGFAGDDFNVALGVETDGICNSRGCFVALDAKSDVGWKIDGTNVVMPPGVCENFANPSGQISLKVLQIVTAKTSADCPQKDVTLSTCGAWSDIPSGTADEAKPLAVAGAQDHPISTSVFRVTPQGGGADSVFAVWTANGDGSVRLANVDSGGSPLIVPSGTPPRDILATEEAVFWTGSGLDGVGALYAWKPSDPPADPVVLKSGLAQPDGLAMFRDASTWKLFWTEFSEPGSVYAADFDVDNFTISNDAALVVGDPPDMDPMTMEDTHPYPARIAADSGYVYWSEEGAFQSTNGSIVRVKHSTPGATPTRIANNLAVPRAIALDVTGGLATALYFANIADGTVWRIPDASSDTPGEAELFAEGMDAPNGLAIDADYVYVTSRGKGAVYRKKKTAVLAEAPEKLAGAQKNPGTILVSQNLLLWVNEGPSSSDAKEGAVVKFDLSKLQQ